MARTPQGKSDLPIKIARKFGRIPVQGQATLVFPFRHAHPRIKGQFFQIGKGGCAISTDEHLFIGEECLVWATGGGKKLLGAVGRVVWMKVIYEGHQTTMVGIEFKEPVQLDKDLLSHLGAKP